ncbi:MAG TPA: ribose-phosphate diphosphokinase [Candidatus Nanoarchaeia archaeon]|nr:ribose-phosphate diphosphokinase [Candidatus Nanoarchaeia archaeon]
MSDSFIIPDCYGEIQRQRMQGPSGWLLFVACNDGLELARDVKRDYDALLEAAGEKRKVTLLNDTAQDTLTKICPDTETIPNLRHHVGGSNAYVFQNVHNLRSAHSVNDNLMQLCQMIRTLKENGAQTVTIVMPYHPYARQDKPTLLEREAILAKLAADLLVESGTDKIITYHPHSDAVRGWYVPRAQVTVLTGLDFQAALAERIFHEKGIDRSTVCCCSTDAGGAKYVIKLAMQLGISHAIGNKYRSGSDKSETLGIVGNITGKQIALIADDETVTFGSLLDTSRALHDTGIKDIYILCSHNKLRPTYTSRLIEAHEKYGVREVHVTNSVPATDDVVTLPFVRVHSLARHFAQTINRHHYNLSVSELFHRG